MAKRWYSRIMFEIIPTFLFQSLVACTLKVRRWRKSLRISPNTGAGEYKVFDLGNCGPRNQFMVGNYQLVAHNCAYGAGVDKVLATLEADDVFLPRDEVEKIHRGYWDLFGEVKQFGRDLQRQWKRNGGYVLNGLGRPMCLPEDYKHDVLNRFIQSTGHDILIQYIYILTNGLTQAGVDWKPWVIDWHDAAAVEVPEHQKDLTIEVYLWALDELNRQLGGQIKLKGVPSWGTTMSDIKEPEE
jgi:hypothetical protein